MLLQAFKHARLRMATPWVLCMTITLGLGVAPAAHAALSEAEPNDSCAAAPVDIVFTRSIMSIGAKSS